MDFAVLIALATSGCVCLYGVWSYNRIVALGARCEQALADIDVQLKQRHDLVPSLVETVRGITTYERATLEAVVAARADAIGAHDPASQLAAETTLGAGLARLMAVAEAYPQLQASPHFASLRDEIVDIENKLAGARRFLNLAVAEHNGALSQFPGSLLGSMFSIEPRKPFDLGLDRIFLDDAPLVKV